MAYTYKLFDRVGYIILEDGKPIEEDLWWNEYEARREAEERIRELEAGE